MYTGRLPIAVSVVGNRKAAARCGRRDISIQALNYRSIDAAKRCEIQCLYMCLTIFDKAKESSSILLRLLGMARAAGTAEQTPRDV